MKTLLCLIAAGSLLFTGCTTTSTSVTQKRDVSATPENIHPASSVDAGKVIQNTPDPVILVAPDEVLKPRR